MQRDPFEYYDVTGGAVRTAASDTRSKGDAVHLLIDNLESDHQRAVSAVEGELRTTVITAPGQSQQAAQFVGRKTAWASCQLEVFADAIDTYNYTSAPPNPRSVQRLNQAWRDGVASNFGVAEPDYPPGASAQEKQDIDDTYATDYGNASSGLYRTLLDEYGLLDDNLDTAAGKVSSNLQRDPTDDELRNAWRDGNLPGTAMLLWPDLNLKLTDIRGGIPPELRSLLGQDLEDYLRLHPELAPVTNVLLRKPNLSPQEQAIVDAQAAIDAQRLNTGLDRQPPGQEGLDDLEAAQARLELINGRVADGGQLTDAEKAYLAVWMNTVGAHNLARVPAYVETAIQDRIPSGMPGYAQAAIYDDLIRQYVTPLSNAIMNLSNPEVGGHRTASDMPDAIQDLLNLRIGESYNGMRFGDAGDDMNPNFDSIVNLDTFNGFADLMKASTVDGGTDFTKELGETALQAKQDMNAMLSKLGADSTFLFVNEEQFVDLKMQLNDMGVSDLLSVVGRDSDASAALVNASPENLQRVLGLNWDDGQGAADVIQAATDRDATDGEGGTRAQADAALAILTEVAGDPSEYEYRVENELVSDAIVDTAIKWIDTFGNDVNSGADPSVNTDATDLLGRDLDFSLTLSPEDRSQFMQYVASTGDEDAVRVQAAAQVYGANLIRDALATDDPVTLNQAMSWAGRADGTITQANFEWAIDQAENDDDAAKAAYLAEVRQNAAINTGIGIVKSVGITATGVAFPPSAPFLSVGDALVTPLINGALENGPAPDVTSIQTREDFYNTDQVESTHTRNYQLAMAIDAEGNAENPEHPDHSVLYNSDGALKTMQEMDPTQLDRLVQERLNAWSHTHNEALNVEAYDTERDNIMNGSHADNDRVSTSGWRDDDAARRLLYGDNVPEGFEDDWENGPRSLYSPDTEQVDDNVWNYEEDDEAAQIRDARGDVAQLEDDLRKAEEEHGRDSDEADDIRDDLEDRQEDLDELIRG